MKHSLKAWTVILFTSLTVAACAGGPDIDDPISPIDPPAEPDLGLGAITSSSHLLFIGNLDQGDLSQYQLYGVDTEDVSALAKPLAPDASDETQWYFPFLSYALASSMTRADGSGNLNPGAALTRGQVALLTHRFLLYREGERNQALLVEAERDMRFIPAGRGAESL